MFEHSWYHKLLRISSLTLALILTFQSGLISPLTRQLSDQTAEYLSAAVGASATIRPSEINTLTAQIATLEKELAAREAADVERTIAVNLDDGPVPVNSDRTTFILSVILFILLVLIVLNYVMDFIRSQRQPVHEQVA